LSGLVALTGECAQWIGAHTAAAHISVIPNPAVCPLPDNPPRIEPEALCPPERKVLLAVGRLNAVKNYEVLTRAFAELAGKYPDWDLVILGEGPERSLLEAGIRDRKLEKRIVMPGIAGNVGTWFARADLYVMTSRSEGFPSALAEALAHGLPAVSFDCNTGPRDIIRHEIDGLLVPPDDCAALVDALDRVMGDPETRKQFAARALDARDRFSLEKIGGMWEELFRELSDTHSVSTVPAKAPVAERCGP
jgi:glycosyltransferase involved in cell wall biosynthesis